MIEKGPAKRSRTRKLKEYKAFQKLKVMKGPQIHRDDFKELQNKEATLKLVRKRTTSADKTNLTNLYPPTKGYLRETCKSQNINSIYLDLEFTFGIIQVITNACQVCFSA